jgi:hypothetical protein
MILASHQPYFFPYIGHYSLISSVDLFIFADTRQFTRNGWMARNRILKPMRKEAQYFHIGLKKPRFKASLSECLLHGNEKWKLRILDQIAHYKKIAPFFSETQLLLHTIFEKKYTTLNGFNIESTEYLLKTFGIKTKTILFSGIEPKVKKATSPGLWGLNTCKAMQAGVFINAPLGESFIPAQEYKKEGIKIGFIQPEIEEYNQFNKKFIPRLSIVDVLMFNGIQKTSDMIRKYYIKWII